MGLEDFRVVALSRDVFLRPDTMLRTSLTAFLEELLAHLKHSGCRTIGHVKGDCRTAGFGPWFFSATSFRGEPHLTEGDCRGPRRLTMRMNVIVEGVDEATISSLVDRSLAAHFNLNDHGVDLL